jgi:hypothetical protein
MFRIEEQKALPFLVNGIPGALLDLGQSGSGNLSLWCCLLEPVVLGGDEGEDKEDGESFDRREYSGVS